MNIFTFLKNYTDPNTVTYGDILERKTTINNLNQQDKEIYENIQKSDKQRLINLDGGNYSNKISANQKSQNIGGIHGNFIQIC